MDTVFKVTCGKRNINRLNEAVERERNAKQQKEDENMKLRESLAKSTRLAQEEENKNTVRCILQGVTLHLITHPDITPDYNTRKNFVGEE